MRLKIILFLILSVSAAYADEIDDGIVTCNNHLSPATSTGPVSQRRLWQPGWEHCRLITAAKIKRDVDKAEADETKNPELKKTRDLSKKLNGEVK